MNIYQWYLDRILYRHNCALIWTYFRIENRIIKKDENFYKIRRKLPNSFYLSKVIEPQSQWNINDQEEKTFSVTLVYDTLFCSDIITRHSRVGNSIHMLITRQLSLAEPKTIESLWIVKLWSSIFASIRTSCSNKKCVNVIDIENLLSQFTGYPESFSECQENFL